jgi:hypothetical protein
MDAAGSSPWRSPRMNEPGKHVSHRLSRAKVEKLIGQPFNYVIMVCGQA